MIEVNGMLHYRKDQINSLANNVYGIHNKCQSGVNTKYFTKLSVQLIGNIDSVFISNLYFKTLTEKNMPNLLKLLE